jgi:hypothetical protein
MGLRGVSGAGGGGLRGDAGSDWGCSGLSAILHFLVSALANGARQPGQGLQAFGGQPSRARYGYISVMKGNASWNGLI